jgi:hypothetical protein
MVAGAKRPFRETLSEAKSNMKTQFEGFAYCSGTSAVLLKMYYTLANLELEGVEKERVSSVIRKINLLQGNRFANEPVMVSQGGKLSRSRKEKKKLSQLERRWRRDNKEWYRRVEEVELPIVPQHMKITVKELDNDPWKSQSGIMEDPMGTQWQSMISSGDEKATVTQFASSADHDQVGLTPHVDPMRRDGTSGDVQLSNFLGRPIKIFETTWEIGDFLREEIDPWTLFLNNSTIEAKTQNFAWIRANLHIKLVINGTQWHYGRGLLSYRPREAGIERSRTPGSAPVIDNVVYSQRPHVTFDPTDCTGGDMYLPFCNPKNWLGLDSVGDKANMGRLVLSSFNQLRIATTNTVAPVTISIFAWMSEVEMAGSTNFVSQSGTGDEYGEGIISKPASALARWAGKLTAVPYIGEYAMATQLGANAVGRIASLFGYCRPVNVEPITKFKPAFAGNIANSSIEEAVDKLTFDPKQELSIDPGLTGYNPKEDELSIVAIAKRRSYMSRFNWTTSIAP